MFKVQIILPCFLGCLFFLPGCKNSISKQAVVKTDSTLYTGAKFNEHIRTTTARTPEDERLGFRLPEGFEVSLFASEPDIGKPINFSFDARGRMWVTQSYEYPFPAGPGTGKDRITILEDTDDDGKADKFTLFNDTLNIPIGIMPVNGGAIAYSIPSVYMFSDFNGDGKPEKQEKILGPFEHKDTHGMVNNLATGFDGWIYACHGFTNRSNIAGADGDSVHLVSGNTIRFRKDGSRVEHHTYGRINPFGLAFDELGYIYSTDCHTSPLYQLITGGDYTQWGKEEGMGFAPEMKPLENEATALAGIAYYGDVQYPEQYRKNLFVGDAVSSRVYRNSFTFNGSTPVGKKEEDFVLSEDPWFRPVDVKMGPDGALYIADFYNSIIGHYEVPLDHPKRDKIRGRIWRITYNGQSHQNTDWTKATIETLVAALKADNIRNRMTAADLLVDQHGAAAVNPVKTLLEEQGTTATAYSHGLWVLQRLGALTEDIIKVSADHRDSIVRLHTIRVLSEREDTSEALYLLVRNALQDENAHVRRAAAELMGRYINMNSVETLISFRKNVPEEDSHIIYTTRLILRNLLRHPALMNEIVSRQWTNEDAAVLSTVLVGVQTPASGTFLFNYLKNRELAGEELPKAFRHIVRFIPPGQINGVISTAMKQAGSGSKQEYVIFRSLREGLARRGARETPAFIDWGKNIAVNLINSNAVVKKEDKREATDQKIFAVDLAGDYKITSADTRIVEIARDTSNPENLRAAAIKALMKMEASKYASLAGELLQSEMTTPGFKRNVISVLSEFPGPSVNTMLANIRNAPPDMQQGIVLALAGSGTGRVLLFDKVKKGEIFPRVLAEPGVKERLMLNSSPRERSTYAVLTAGVDEIDKEKQSIISGRISDFNNLTEKPSANSGRSVFVKNCAACHSIKGEGGAIGPQLDGVGKWGVGPLTEKILDPNRNISENFRNYTLNLKGGKVLSGLYRRDEGEVIVFADVSGKEFSVPKKEILEKTASKYTLMPDQFRHTIPPEEFNALIAYLLTQKN